MRNESDLLPWQDKNPRILVIGDPILDEYLEGNVTRISPEAPVPVHLVTNHYYTAGGAANVARNIQLAGGSAHLCGAWGKDQTAQKLKQLLVDEHINCENMVTDPDKPTIRKTRVTSKGHHIVRIDWEKIDPISETLQKKVLAKILQTECDTILISDYAKGGLTPPFIQELVQLYRKRNIPVVIDPKGNQYDKYQGASLITPNYKEACDALGIDPLEKWPKEYLAKELKQKFKVSNVVVTLGPHGMFGLFENGETHYLDAVKREVFDVSGAGDTVVAVMALCIASGTDLKRAMFLANTAAGIVVSKWGTYAIHKHELLDALDRHPEHSEGTKIQDRASLAKTLGKPQQRDSKVVFTNGCFDILHVGHISYLEKARALGDKLVVAVNTDASVRKLKGKERPVNNLEARMKMLAALSFVDYVTWFDEDTPAEIIEQLGPQVLVKGADYKKGEVVGAKYVESIGGRVELIDFVDGYSTSNLISRLKD